jgi:hypothetical protein
MARSKIRSQGVQINEDTGAILYSLIKGEQVSFKINLSFLTDLDDYEVEAVIIEGLNTGSGKVPKDVRPSGVETILTVYIPPYQGVFNPVTAYSKNDVVSSAGLKYIKLSGTTEVTATLDTTWALYTNNAIYLHFPTGLISAWTVQPTPDKAVYGFFDLRVTEPVGTLPLRHTYKPMQGLIEFSYSPTDEAP